MTSTLLMCSIQIVVTVAIIIYVVSNYPIKDKPCSLYNYVVSAFDSFPVDKN